MGTSVEQWEAAWEDGGSSSHGASDEISAETSIRDSVSQRVMPPVWESKHKVFLSHSAAQKPFVSDVSVELGRRARYPFLDKEPESLPLGEPFAKLIFDGIKRCMVVVVFLSEEFFTRGKWPMLEVAAMVRRMVRRKKSDPRFNIIPVFFSISPDKCRDNLTQWKSHWEKLKSKDEPWLKFVDDDMKEDMTIDINEWEMALNFLLNLGGCIKGEGMTEPQIRANIVEEVCKLVPRENRWITNSDIQGRDHLLKELREVVVPMQKQGKPNLGMRLVGLYGVRGSGKSTLSKVLCNEVSKEFGNKVHYIHFPSSWEGSESSRKGLENLSLKQLLREMLKEFTYLRHDVIDKLDEVECSTYLRTVKDKVFLVIDNVIDDSRSIELAKELKASPFGNGSVILIISSSSDVLVKNLGIDKGNCLEMPDLREDDAKALFLAKATVVPPNFPKNEEEESLLMQCIKRCYFSKGHSSNSCQYHPLALKVLGVGLSRYGYDPEQWKTALEEIESTFNQFQSECSYRDEENQVFAIFKNSFDSLNDDLQKLFMDAALFLPTDEGTPTRWGFFDTLFVQLSPERGIPMFTDIEWLGMVHGKSVKATKHMLEDLKKKAIVETVDDDFIPCIGMHDLWREFAFFETKVHDASKESEKRFKWIYEEQVQRSQLRKSEKALSMFLGFQSWPGGSKTLKLNDLFPYVAVLSMEESPGPDVVLDIEELDALKSLEVTGNRFNFHGLHTLQNLTFLRLWNMASDSAYIGEIGHLINLQVLDLNGYQSHTLPDLKKLKKLQVLNLRGNDSARGIYRTIDLRNLTSLKFLDVEWSYFPKLDLSGCSSLRRVWGLHSNERVNILNFSGCKSLEELPDLGCCPKLTQLHMRDCEKIQSLEGLKHLKFLNVLDITGCSSMSDVGDLSWNNLLCTIRAKGCHNLTKLALRRRNRPNLVLAFFIKWRDWERVLEIEPTTEVTTGEDFGERRITATLNP